MPAPSCRFPPTPIGRRCWRADSWPYGRSGRNGRQCMEGGRLPRRRGCGGRSPGDPGVDEDGDPGGRPSCRQGAGRPGLGRLGGAGGRRHRGGGVTELVLVEREGSIARLTLNRPEQRNAVSAEMLDQLTRAFGDLAADPQVRVVILAGAGSDFCAGADIEELAAARERADGLDYGASFDGALRAIEDTPVPVIARVHGAALGAGCQITVACDLAVAAEDARLGIPSSRLGVLINFENVQR